MVMVGRLGCSPIYVSLGQSDFGGFSAPSIKDEGKVARFGLGAASSLISERGMVFFPFVLSKIAASEGKFCTCFIEKTLIVMLKSL